MTQFSVYKTDKAHKRLQEETVIIEKAFESRAKKESSWFQLEAKRQKGKANWMKMNSFK